MSRLAVVPTPPDTTVPRATPTASGALDLGGTSFPYELVLENAIVGISCMRDRRFVWANARMAEIFGYTPGELDGQPVRLLYSSQADYDAVGCTHAALARASGYTHERAMLTKQGELLWCLISGRRIDPADPKSVSVWVVQDISDKKRAEDQLRRANQRLEQTIDRRTVNLHRSNDSLRAEVERRRAAQEVSVESREKYRALFRHMPMGVLVTNAEGEIIEANRTVQSYLGAASRAQLDTLTQDASRLQSPQGEAQSLAELLRERTLASRARRVDRFELRWLNAQGKPRDFSVVAAPLLGHGLGVAYALTDVTEQKRARDGEHAQQAALAHAARLSLMGQIASTLAHELGQPLNACQSYLAGVQLRMAEDLIDRPELGQALAKAAGHLDQARDIIRNVRGFVSRHQPDLVTVDMVALVRQTLALLDVPLRSAHARVRFELPPTLPQVRCQPVEIQQVLVNLIVNALDAMAATPPDERVVDVVLATEGRGKLSVQIIDHGPGVSGPDAEQIFEPYFTTKSAGLGMGLMICRTIVESHGGSLRLLPQRAGMGACFRFTLPLERDAP